MSKKENALARQKKDAESGLANAPTKKKIGFFSAMMVVVGATTAAGIFFKAGTVLHNSQNSIIFAMFCWVFTAFAVICMALALIEIASARNDNMSIIGWCQTFNNRFIYKACKNFMCYIYLPLTFFFMPLYAIMSIQDGVSAAVGTGYNGFGTNADWAIVMVLTLVISIYFLVVCGLSSRMGNIQNWIITAFKFIPLVFGGVIGFVVIGVEGGIANPDYTPGFNPSDFTAANGAIDYASLYSFANMTPGIGMFIAIGAIFFAYDGFYVSAGLQTEMKEPKKTPMAMLFGLIIVTVIYLIIAISMTLGSLDGNPYGLLDFMKKHNIVWLYSAFQILIGIGVLGIINGFALWSTRFVEDLISANDLPFARKYVNKLNAKRAKVGIVYNLVISIPIIIIFCVIGGLGYINTNYPGADYGAGVPELYSFADLMATWSSVGAFIFLLCCLAGALRNRKTKLVKVEEVKIFKPMAIICLITMTVPIFITFFQPMADLFFLFRIPSDAPLGSDGLPVYDYETVLVSRIMTVVVLLIFLSLIFLPTVIEDAINTKKYGSLIDAEIANTKLIAEAKNKSLEQEIIDSLVLQRRTYLKDWEQKALHQEQLTEKQLRKIAKLEEIERENEPELVRFDSNNAVSVPTE